MQNRIKTNYWLELSLLIVTEFQYLAAPGLVLFLLFGLGFPTHLKIIGEVAASLIAICIAGYSLYVGYKHIKFHSNVSTSDLEAFNQMVLYWAPKENPPKMYISVLLSSCWVPGRVFLKQDYLPQPMHVWKYILDHEYAHSLQQDQSACLSPEHVKELIDQALQEYPDEAKEDLVIEIDADAYALQQTQCCKTKTELNHLLTLADKLENPSHKKANTNVSVRCDCLVKLGILQDA